MFIGILMIIIGICHLMKRDLFFAKNTRSLIGEEKFKSYQKGLVFPYLLLGTIMICMGIVEETINIQTSLFVTIYLTLAVIPLILILINNKKYTNRYVLQIKNN